jgi:hypothetical protein
MAYTKYSLTPANNTAAPPDGAPEGMLPSAVNDTMRDMMAQIRDVGDGVRDGTYTMTAVKITGGTINNATIGATTATTGKFTAVTNSALTSGRVTLAGASGVLQDSAGLTYDGAILTISSGASASALTATSTSSGGTALNIQNSGTVNALIGGYLSCIGSGSASDVAVAAYQGALAFATNGANERMRINAGAPILCLSGGNTSATGTGIAFPSTQSASADANTLDDYEEGTWAPTVTLNSGTATTYTIATGTYTKTGRMVVVLGSIVPTNGTLGSTNGYIRMTGLPFTVGTRNGAGSGANVSNLNNGVSTTMAYSTTVDVAFASGVTSANEYVFAVTYFV